MKATRALAYLLYYESNKNGQQSTSNNVHCSEATAYVVNNSIAIKTLTHLPMRSLPKHSNLCEVLKFGHKGLSIRNKLSGALREVQ